VSAIPKPLPMRLAHTLKQDHNKGAVTRRQVIALQTAVAGLQTGTTITAPTAPGSTYSEAQAASVVTALTELITALTSAGIIG